jgi:hypothetical protein
LAQIWCGLTSRHTYRESRSVAGVKVCRTCGHRTKIVQAARQNLGAPRT